MTQFDMPLGWFMWIMFPCDRRCRKRRLFPVMIRFFCFFFCSLSLTITRILGEFIASEAKTHYFCQTKEIIWWFFVQVPTDVIIYKKNGWKKNLWRRPEACWLVWIKGDKEVRRTLAWYSSAAGCYWLRRGEPYSPFISFEVKVNARHVLSVTAMTDVPTVIRAFTIYIVVVSCYACFIHRFLLFVGRMCRLRFHRYGDERVLASTSILELLTCVRSVRDCAFRPDGLAVCTYEHSRIRLGQPARPKSSI